MERHQDQKGGDVIPEENMPLNDDKGEQQEFNGTHQHDAIETSAPNLSRSLSEKPSFKLFGFEFAPLIIPLERRLQVHQF